jgi:hypothetical protein
MRALLAAAAIVLAVTACGAFSAGGGDDNGAGSLDAGGTTSSTEGGAPRDSGGIESSPPGTDFCAGRTHAFCTGFDLSGPPFGFTSVATTFAYSFGDSFVSAPHSLLLSAGDGDGNDKFLSWAFTDPGNGPSSIKVQFQMLLASSAEDIASSDARLVEISCNDGNYVRLKLKPTGTLQIGGKDGANVITAAPATKQTWGDVTLVWNLLQANVSLATSLTDSKMTVAPATCPPPFTVALGFGGWLEAPRGAYSVAFDNFEIVLN